jgi:hypothetical protein
VSFRDAWRNRTVVSTTFGDLRASKRASGRPKDLADLALLDELALATKAVGGKRRTRTAARGSRRGRTGSRRRAGL